MKIYYAHPINLYGTRQEARDILTLERLGMEVVNPNSKEISEMYNRIKRNKSFEEAFKEVFLTGMILNCDGVAFRATPDGKITKGVFLEIEYAKLLGLPVFELPSSVLSRSLNDKQTLEYLKEVGNR